MLTIRLAQRDDLPAIAAFDAFDHDPVREVAEQRMMVAEQAGAIVGFFTIAPKSFVGRDFIAFLAVNPASHRSGFGRFLLRAAADQFKGARVYISTEVDNVRMLGLLASEEWVAAGVVEGANKDGRAEAFFFKDIPA